MVKTSKKVFHLSYHGSYSEFPYLTRVYLVLDQHEICWSILLSCWRMGYIPVLCLCDLFSYVLTLYYENTAVRYWIQYLRSFPYLNLPTWVLLTGINLWWYYRSADFLEGAKLSPTLLCLFSELHFEINLWIIFGAFPKLPHNWSEFQLAKIFWNYAVCGHHASIGP